jgi:hypothetical protein
MSLKRQHITPTSFHWTADVDEGEGETPHWHRHVEFFARRIAG